MILLGQVWWLAFRLLLHSAISLISKSLSSPMTIEMWRAPHTVPFGSAPTSLTPSLAPLASTYDIPARNILSVDLLLSSYAHPWKSQSSQSFNSCRWLLSHNLQILSFLLTARFVYLTIWTWYMIHWWKQYKKTSIPRIRINVQRYIGLICPKQKSLFAFINPALSFVQTILFLISSSLPVSSY